MSEPPKLPKYIQNLATESLFALVDPSNPDQISSFISWANDVHSRSLTKHVNISIDCEGNNLAIQFHSLTLVQIGEIFNDDFDIQTPNLSISDTPEIGRLSGYAITFPAPQSVKDALSLILNNPKIIKFTFDFTGDFSALMEEGIRISPQNVFDAQVYSPTPTNDRPFFFILSRNLPSLRKEIKKAENLDPLGPKANEVYYHSKGFDFEITFFKNRNHPSHCSYTQDFLQMAVLDVFFNGLAAKHIIKLQKVQQCFQNSLIKWDQMISFIRKTNCPLGASMIRNMSFINPKIQKIVLGNRSHLIDNEKAIKKTIKGWRMLKDACLIYEAIGNYSRINCPLSCIQQTLEIYEDALSQVITTDDIPTEF